MSWETELGLVLLAVVFTVLILSGGPDISTVVTQETLQNIVVDPTSMGRDAT